MWRFAPYMALGVVALVIGAFFAGCMEGSQRSDEKWTAKWEGQQSEFMQAQAERTNRALQAMADQHINQARVARRINEVVIPDAFSCTDPEWVRAHDQAVQAANGP